MVGANPDAVVDGTHEMGASLNSDPGAPVGSWRGKRTVAVLRWAFEGCVLIGVRTLFGLATVLRTKTRIKADVSTA